MGPFHFLAERVGFNSLASRAPCQHAAARLRWSNRVLILSRTRPENKIGPWRGPFCFWRWSESWAEDALGARHVSQRTADPPKIRRFTQNRLQNAFLILLAAHLK